MGIIKDIEDIMKRIAKYNPDLGDLFNKVFGALASIEGIFAISFVVLLKIVHAPWQGVFLGGLIGLFLGHGIYRRLHKGDFKWSALGGDYLQLAVLVATSDKNKAPEEIKGIARVLHNEFRWEKSEAEVTVKRKFESTDLSHNVVEKEIREMCIPLNEKTTYNKDFRIVMFMFLREVVAADKHLACEQLKCLEDIAKCFDIRKELYEKLIAHNPRPVQ